MPLEYINRLNHFTQTQSVESFSFNSDISVTLIKSNQPPECFNPLSAFTFNLNVSTSFKSFH